VIYRAVPAAPPSIVPRLNLLVIFSDINSEFNLLNAKLVTAVGYQLILSIAAKEQHQRAKGVSKRGNGSCCEKTRCLRTRLPNAAKHTSNADDSTKWRATVDKDGHFYFAVAL
jgi:hypothetical protein